MSWIVCVYHTAISIRIGFEDRYYFNFICEFYTLLVEYNWNGSNLCKWERRSKNYKAISFNFPLSCYS